MIHLTLNPISPGFRLWERCKPMSFRRRHQLVTTVADDIRRILQVLRLSARRVERELGISAAQLFVLQKLVERPAASMNELAERTLTHQSSVSVVVRRLVARRLVARERSADDGRRIELRLTAAGKRLLQAAPTLPQVRAFETLRQLEDDELRTVARVLHLLAESVGAARLQPQMLFADSAGVVPGRRRVPRDSEGEEG